MSSTCQRKPNSLWGKQCSLSAGMVHCSNSKVPPLHSMLCQGQINMASYHTPEKAAKISLIPNIMFVQMKALRLLYNQQPVYVDLVLLWHDATLSRYCFPATSKCHETLSQTHSITFQRT